MSLYAFGRADYEDCEIQDLEDALGLRREVHMPRGVEQGHREIAVFKIGLLRKNGDPAAFLRGVGVQKGRAVIDASRRAERTGGDEEGLGKRGFAGIHVRQDAERQAAHQFLVRWKAKPPISSLR